jgi:hypothetical protein
LTCQYQETLTILTTHTSADSTNSNLSPESTQKEAKNLHPEGRRYSTHKVKEKAKEGSPKKRKEKEEPL